MPLPPPRSTATGAPVRRRPRPRVVAGTLALVAGAALLGGCGVRLESPPPTPPVPDAVEEVRQDGAVDAATIATTVAEVTGAEGEVAEVLERVAEQARTHADALGGVWEAWPGGAPEGVTTAPVRTDPPVADPAPQDVLDLLTAGAADARAASLASPDDAVAAVLASVSIARSHAAADLAGALGEDLGPAAGAELSPDALVARGSDGPTLLVLDQARHAFETVAARSTGTSREAAAGRAAHLQLLVDTALADGAPDRRPGVYDLPDATDDLSAEQAAAVDAESRLLAHWVFSITLTGPEQRESLLAAAELAAGQVRAWGGTLEELPGLG